nr:hypothetical protein MarFTME_019 [Marseillevirus futianmevirus]
MESKFLPQVLSLLKERNVSDFSYELCDVEEDFVEVKFFLERKTFSWIEADFGHDTLCVLWPEKYGSLLGYVGDVLGQNDVCGTD